MRRAPRRTACRGSRSCPCTCRAARGRTRARAPQSPAAGRAPGRPAPRRPPPRTPRCCPSLLPSSARAARRRSPPARSAARDKSFGRLPSRGRRAQRWRGGGPAAHLGRGREALQPLQRVAAPGPLGGRQAVPERLVQLRQHADGLRKVVRVRALRWPASAPRAMPGGVSLCCAREIAAAANPALGAQDACGWSCAHAAP